VISTVTMLLPWIVLSIVLSFGALRLSYSASGINMQRFTKANASARAAVLRQQTQRDLELARVEGHEEMRVCLERRMHVERACHAQQIGACNLLHAEVHRLKGALAEARTVEEILRARLAEAERTAVERSFTPPAGRSLSPLPTPRQPEECPPSPATDKASRRRSAEASAATAWAAAAAERATAQDAARRLAHVEAQLKEAMAKNRQYLQAFDQVRKATAQLSAGAQPRPLPQVQSSLWMAKAR